MIKGARKIIQDDRRKCGQPGKWKCHVPILYKAKTIRVTSLKMEELNVVDQNQKVDQIARVMDMGTFIASATCIIIFNAVYWLH